MLKVKPIDEETINGWQISESGLTARAVNACTAAGITTIGMLRRYNNNDLGKIKRMGNQSVQAIRSFLQTCNEIQAGNMSFNNLQALFTFFLSRSQYDTLNLRYRLHAKGRNNKTLEEIGRKYAVTRERVRQVEGKARKILSSQLAQACLSGIYELYEDAVGNNNLIATDETISNLPAHPLIAGYNTANLLHLLSDCSPRITFHNSCYSLIAPERIKEVENKALGLLNSAKVPVLFDFIFNSLSADLPHGMATLHQNILVYILRHNEKILSTIDDRYMAGNTGIASFIGEILQKLAQPLHFRLIMHEFNKLVQPHSRKGSGFILDILCSNPQFHKVSCGNYELAIRT
ncbi:MAG: hypothetical protein A2283_19240 [Lentisphaerae bacterium RIFOXYA12_FULL_48_11]|nr:MAG: hypothetical protein A2283_19240 [Lentisphaerae bacterium RIFOXYA12_FULL_48_11]